ncbi:MAG: DsrE family protein [Sulfuricurvum sp.]|uniref:DsrE family protein n=1 Tax=Sulfuricurvum sp. TaxID=2025608 RepID=UPI00261112A0|nr:DsrE family protein [Sulfuricurvum sp.]MDD5159055.1 DsrE family protein [Sulfuricurvum sp.]
MKKCLLILALSGILFAEEGVKLVVFDLKTGDIGTFEKKVLQGIAFEKSYYEGKLEKLDVAVVVHGDAYKFFVKDLKNSPYKDDKKLAAEHDQLAKRLATMADTYEVEFLMCEATMRALKIDKSNVYDYVKLTPNSTIGLIDKQNEHFAYIPIH